MVGTNFGRRCILLDYNKQCFEYLLKRKSDYLVFDVLDARIPIYKRNGHSVSETIFFLKNRSALHNCIDMQGYVDVDPFVDISEEETDKALRIICEKILQAYSPGQIIINKHFSVQNYCTDHNVIAFPTRNCEEINYYKPSVFFNSQEGIKKTNELSSRLFDEVADILHGCHIIDFPENVLADRAHKWGLAPLHYLPEYYEYGSKAIDIITGGHSDQKEKDELKRLHELYSEKNELAYKKREVSSLKAQLQGVRSVMYFTRSMLFDLFDSDNFTQWLKNCSSSGKKVAVLKCRDIAGQILLKALNKYNIEIIMESFRDNFMGLSADEIELCRKADIIITADVHSAVPVEYEELKAVRIAELVKGAG